MQHPYLSEYNDPDEAISCGHRFKFQFNDAEDLNEAYMRNALQEEVLKVHKSSSCAGPPRRVPDECALAVFHVVIFAFVRESHVHDAVVEVV